MATLEEEGKNKLGNISHKRRVTHGVVCAGMDLPILDKAICQQQRRTCSWELDDLLYSTTQTAQRRLLTVPAEHGGLF